MKSDIHIGVTMDALGQVVWRRAARLEIRETARHEQQQYSCGYLGRIVFSQIRAPGSANCTMTLDVRRYILEDVETRVGPIYTVRRRREGIHNPP